MIDDLADSAAELAGVMERAADDLRSAVESHSVDYAWAVITEMPNVMRAYAGCLRMLAKTNAGLENALDMADRALRASEDALSRSEDVLAALHREQMIQLGLLIKRNGGAVN